MRVAEIFPVNIVPVFIAGLKDNIKFKLRVPTFAEYTADGMGWINKINSAIDAFIVEEGDEAEAKTQLLDQYVRSSILRQFNHFIDYIEIDEETYSENSIEDGSIEVYDEEMNEVRE